MDFCLTCKILKKGIFLYKSQKIFFCFSCQTFWWIIKMDCCLWALSGPEGGEGTISKMCVQFNILDSILIFVPNIWGSFQV